MLGVQEGLVMNPKQGTKIHIPPLQQCLVPAPPSARHVPGLWDPVWRAHQNSWRSRTGNSALLSNPRSASERDTRSWSSGVHRNVTRAGDSSRWTPGGCSRASALVEWHTGDTGDHRFYSCDCYKPGSYWALGHLLRLNIYF